MTDVTVVDRHIDALDDATKHTIAQTQIEIIEIESGAPLTLMVAGIAVERLPQSTLDTIKAAAVDGLKDRIRTVAREAGLGVKATHRLLGHMMPQRLLSAE